MKKIALALIAAATALSAVPAAAQTATGTVNVTGTVAGRCSIIEAGVDKQTFTGSIDLGRLDAANGTLRSDLGGATAADGKTVAARVVCTSANPTIGVSATRLNTGGAIDPGAGYSNDIDYTASLKVKTAAATTPTEVQYKTDVNTTMVKQKLAGRIAGGTDNNVEVSISALKAENGAASILNEGTYRSVVSVSIEPTI
ncbi:MAG TPA: hypothetical protein VIL42_02130 [Sphingomicrobium sp.]